MPAGKCKSKSKSVTPARIVVPKNQIIARVGEDVEKLELPYIAGRKVKEYSHVGKQYESSSKSYTQRHQMTQQFHSKVDRQEN